jgi:F0F1-type ATP synthase assembly protein I
VSEANNQKEKMFKKYGIATLLIFEIIAFVVLGFFAGDFLDEKLSLGGFGMLGGVLSGFVAGFYKFYIDAKRFLK